MHHFKSVIFITSYLLAKEYLPRNGEMDLLFNLLSYIQFSSDVMPYFASEFADSEAYTTLY